MDPFSKKVPAKVLRFLFQQQEYEKAMKIIDGMMMK